MPTDHDHIAGLSTLAQPHQFVVNYLYQRLNVIDQKLARIVNFNGIILAGIIGVSRWIGPSIGANPLDLLLLVVALVLVVLTVIWCIQLSSLSWEHLDATASNREEYLKKISTVTEERTKIYNRAATLTLVSFSLTILWLILSLFSEMLLKHSIPK